MAKRGPVCRWGSLDWIWWILFHFSLLATSLLSLSLCTLELAIYEVTDTQVASVQSEVDISHFSLQTELTPAG